MKPRLPSFGSIDRWEDEGGAQSPAHRLPASMKARRLLAAATIELWGGSLPVRIRKRLLANAVRNRYASTAALRRAIAGQIRGRRQDG